MATIRGSAIVGNGHGHDVIADNDGGNVRITLNSEGTATQVITYLLALTGVKQNPTLLKLRDGRLLLTYITGTNTRNYKRSTRPDPRAAGDWVTP